MSSTPPLGRLYHVNGRRLLLHKEGTGPAVVFLPGAELTGLDYLNIHSRITGFATSVLYDRGGTGASDRLELPRTAIEVTIELHDLLRTAAVPGPYILVAHSLGGVYARRFSQLYPEEVAGVLSIEGLQEEWDFYMPERFQLAALPAAGPEQANLVAVVEELKGKGEMPEVPLIVITALGQERTRSDDAEHKITLYNAIAKSVRYGENRILSDANPGTVHLDRPDAVVQAIRALVNRSVARRR